MTIDEAMTTLIYVSASPSYPSGSDAFQALKLGIEALKRVKEQRNPNGCITETLLLGETEEAHSSTG